MCHQTDQGNAKLPLGLPHIGPKNALYKTTIIMQTSCLANKAPCLRLRSASLQPVGIFDVIRSLEGRVRRANIHSHPLFPLMTNRNWIPPQSDFHLFLILFILDLRSMLSSRWVAAARWSIIPSWCLSSVTYSHCFNRFQEIWTIFQE